MAREIESDYCIAGAGIAGLLVASKLAESGKQILILDQGPGISEKGCAQMSFEQSSTGYVARTE
jgi:flavin-dependent dehydrogenase